MKIKNKNIKNIFMIVSIIFIIFMVIIIFYISKNKTEEVGFIVFAQNPPTPACCMTFKTIDRAPLAASSFFRKIINKAQNVKAINEFGIVWFDATEVRENNFFKCVVNGKIQTKCIYYTCPTGSGGVLPIEKIALKSKNCESGRCCGYINYNNSTLAKFNYCDVY